MGRQTGYAVMCRDKRGASAGEIRQSKMAEHFAYVESTVDKLLIAGPLYEGDQVTGSLLIYNVDSADEARALAEGDPYGQEGLWESITVGKFVCAAGDWVGGKTW